MAKIERFPKGVGPTTALQSGTPTFYRQAMIAPHITEDDIGVTAHERNLSPYLRRCPVQLTPSSQRLLAGAILSALYGRIETPETHDLNLSAINGDVWRVEIEPFSEKLAYTFWVRLRDGSEKQKPR